jgi:hypothetical protein
MNSKKKLIEDLKSKPEVIADMEKLPLFIALEGLYNQNMTDEQVAYVLTYFYHNTIETTLTSGTIGRQISHTLTEEMAGLFAPMVIFLDDKYEKDHYKAVTSFAAIRALESLSRIKKELIDGGAPESALVEFDNFAESIKKSVVENQDSNIE